MRAGRLSEVNVRIQITEDTGLDLTGNAVSIAIVPAGTVPTVDDLTAATFDGTIAYVLDGPRDAGIYDVHYRLTDNPERPFEFAGTHVRY